MKLFLSWSGEESKHVAKCLKEWLLLLFPTLDIWVSSENINAGDRWSKKLGECLDDTNFGILCITKENLNSPWILYEAGALSKSLSDGSIVPYMVDLEFSDLPGPLSHFQAVKSDKNGTKKMIQSVSLKIPENRRTEAILNKLFELTWDELENSILKKDAATNSIFHSDLLPTVTFVKAKGLLIEIEGRPMAVNAAEFMFYMFLAKRSVENEPPFTSYKSAFHWFQKWGGTGEIRTVFRDYAFGIPFDPSGIGKTIASLRKKITELSLDDYEDQLIPKAKKVGIHVNLVTDWFNG